MASLKNGLLILAIVIGISLTLSFGHSEVCPYAKLSRFGNPELFAEVGAIASDQNLLHYETEETGRYDCIEDVSVCTYYLDWDGYIRQCEEGYFVP